VSVQGGLQATIDPYLYNIVAILPPERKAEEVLEALEVEIDRLKQQPPKKAELERAMKQARALFAYGSESTTNQAFWLGFAEMFDTYEWFTHYLDRLSEVTPQDVQHAAQTYFKWQGRVVGIYLPERGEGQG
jgi:zinc protease